MRNENTLSNTVIEKKTKIQELISKKTNKDLNKKVNNDLTEDNKSLENTIKYIVGDTYYIDGVKYIPKEDYTYEEIGLANFYGKELHNVKTINNDKNKVTELLGRHKTLPIPSIVKITNLDNGYSIILKINDRHNDNSTIIQVSRKTAQLLKFYKNKIAKVKIQILADPSKQIKVVTKSMNEKNFNETIKSAPTETVLISDIDSNSSNETKISLYEQPIELEFEKIENNELFLKVKEFKSYKSAKSILSEIGESYMYTAEKDGNRYNLIIGPLSNIEANNLVSSFISKGYKNTEFIIE